MSGPFHLEDSMASNGKGSGPPNAAQLEAIKALIAVQDGIANPSRTGTVQVDATTESRYPELDNILADARPLLAENGLLLKMNPVMSDDHKELGFAVVFHHQGGGVIDYEPMWFPSGNTAWERGSAWTYARRYSLMNALGIAGEDTDAAEMPKALQRTRQSVLPAGASSREPKGPNDAQIKGVKNRMEKLDFSDEDVKREAESIRATDWQTVSGQTSRLITHLDRLLSDRTAQLRDRG